MPTFQTLIKAGFSVATAFPTALLLLSLFYGALSTILGFSGINALHELSGLMAQIPNDDPDSLKKFITALEYNLPSLLLYQVTSTLMLGLCLPLWVRHFFYDTRATLTGGMAALIRRGVRAFVHLIFAFGVGLFAAAVIILAVTSATQGAGAIGAVVSFIAIGFALWLMAALVAAGHIAAFQEAIDLPISLFRVIKRLDKALAPLASSFIILYLFLSFGGSIVAGIISSPLPESTATAASAWISAAFSFLVSAVFIAGVIKTAFFDAIRKEDRP